MTLSLYIKLGLSFMRAARACDVEECAEIAIKLRYHYGHSEKRLRATMALYGMPAESIDVVIDRLKPVLVDVTNGNR